MNIVILIFSLFLITLSKNVQADSVNQLNQQKQQQQQQQQSVNEKHNSILNSATGDSKKDNNFKRDSSDQIGIYGGGKFTPSEYYSPYQQDYYQPKQSYSAFSPEISFIKSETKTQHPSVIGLHNPLPIIAYNSPYIGGIKPSVQQNPIQIAYAVNPPAHAVQYALAISPVQHHHHPQQILFAARPAPAATTMPYAFLNIPHNLGHIDKSGVGVGGGGLIQYAIIQAPELPIAKYMSPQSFIAPQPSLYHQPIYAYTIQPSVQIASSKQISAASTPAVQLKPVISPKASGTTTQYKFLPSEKVLDYSSYPQRIPLPIAPKAAVPVVSASTVSPPIAFSSTAAPVYSTAKSAYVNAHNGFRYVSETPPMSYIQPNVVHYGTHLYHPSLNKISTALISPQKY